MICGRKSSRLWPPSLPPWCCGGFPLPLGFCGPGPHLYLWWLVFQDPSPSSGCWCQVPTPFHCWWVFKPPPLLPIGVKWVSSRPAVVGEGGGGEVDQAPPPHWWTRGSGLASSVVKDTWISPHLLRGGIVEQAAQLAVVGLVYSPSPARLVIGSTFYFSTGIVWSGVYPWVFPDWSV